MGILWRHGFIECWLRNSTFAIAFPCRSSGKPMAYRYTLARQAKVQTHRSSILANLFPNRVNHTGSKVHYHHKTVSHWQHWCIHMSQEGIGSICKGPKREQLEATEEDRCLTAEGDRVRRDPCVWSDPKGEAVHLWRWQGATTQENHAEKRSNGSTIFQRTSHENWRTCFHIVSPYQRGKTKHK